MRTTIILAGMAINLILIVGIIYLNYFAPRPGSYTTTPAQQSPKKHGRRKIAIIIPASEPSVDEMVEGFTTTIQKDAQFEADIRVFNSNRSRTLLRSNIEAAIEEGYDVLVANGSQAAQMTKEVTEKRKRLIPVVFVGTGDPVKLELVNDPDNSGNHLTGVSVVGLEWIDQMVDLIPIIAPFVKHVLVPYNPTGLGGALETYKQYFDKALERNNLKTRSIEIFETNEIGEKLAPFIGDTDMVMVLPDGTLIDGMNKISKLCRQNSKALYVAQNMGALKEGATFGFGYHPYDVGVAAVQTVRRILEDNVRPTNIPVNRLTDTYRVGLNVDNARDQNVLDKMNDSIVFLLENGEVI